MKNIRIISILGLLIALVACNIKHPKEYNLKGDIKGYNEGTIVLSYNDLNNRTKHVIDSGVVRDGKFEITGIMEFPMKLSATINPGNYKFSIWLENSKIMVLGDISKAEGRNGRFKLPVKISGSPIQAEQDAYDALRKPILDELSPYNEAYYNANLTYAQALKSGNPKEEIEVLESEAQRAYNKIKPFSKKLNDINLQYIDEHPSSFITATILNVVRRNMEMNEVQSRYEALSEEVKKSYIGQNIKAAIEKSLKGSPGSLAPEFAKEDIDGNKLSLADFRGQYVLLDFWASWCKPCRAGNPHLIKLYNKYHKMGVEFIGIASDDNKPKAWHKAVEKDRIGIWRHILAGDHKKGENIGNRYAIHTLPTKVLIDPEGKIIGRFGSDGEMDEEMDKMFEMIFEK